MAGDMATWLVAHSQMHPDFSELPVMYDMNMGGFEDPTTRNTASRFEGLILQLQVQPALPCCISTPISNAQGRLCCKERPCSASTQLVLSCRALALPVLSLV